MVATKSAKNNMSPNSPAKERNKTDTRIGFLFNNGVEIYYLYSFAFVYENGNLISFAQLEQFSERISQVKMDIIRDIEFEKPKTGYAIHKNYVSSDNRPLVITLANPKNNEATSNEYRKSMKPFYLLKLQIRLTQYGVLSVRLKYKMRNKSRFDDIHDFGNYIYDDLFTQSKVTAEKAKSEIIDIWNQHQKKKTRKVNVDSGKETRDQYTVLSLKNTEISHGNTKYSLSDFKGGELASLDSNSVRAELEKMLLGITISSPEWDYYPPQVVKRFIESDLSTTEREFQFVTWKHVLIYYKEEAPEEPSPLFSKYQDYLSDMLLGLELFFIIRASLRMLEERIDKQVLEIAQLTRRSNFYNLCRTVPELSHYYNILIDYDKWLLKITDLRSFHRFGDIPHLINFLKYSLKVMGIEMFLDVINGKIEILRENLKARSSTINSCSILFLTLLLTILGVYTIIAPIIPRILVFIGKLFCL